MPQGLQVWDAEGNLVADVTDRMGSVVTSGALTFTTSSEAYTIGVTGMVDNGSWYVSCTGYVACRINTGSFTLSRYDRVSPTEVHYYTVIKQ